MPLKYLGRKYSAGVDGGLSGGSRWAAPGAMTPMAPAVNLLALTQFSAPPSTCLDRELGDPSCHTCTKNFLF